MSKLMILAAAFLLFSSSGFATTVIEGRVESIDRTAKTVVVRAKDGTVHKFRMAEQTAIHGSDKATSATKETLQGFKEGSAVAVSYTASGADEIAQEIHQLGEGGMKSSKGTITQLDQNAKTVTIKSEDGTEHVFRLTNQAAADAGKDFSADVHKSAKVTVYYTQQAGHQVAHFFSKNF